MARTPHVLTIHPGAPFLATFAQRLLNGDVVSAIGPHMAPLDFAAATIYVPTRRAARALSSELIRRLPGPAVLLPKIVPLGHLESIETGLLFDAGDGPVEGVPDAMSTIERRMILMRLVHAWAARLAYAITHAEGADIKTDESEALLVARAPAQAWHLAGDLAALIDEMIVEDADWSKLQDLAPHEFDRYWAVTIQFLTIASQVWPDILGARELVDAATRQRLLVDREIARLGRQDAGAPVIAIGSTGTNRATARLLAAIARLDQGAVVLPGLDRTLDETAWRMIDGDAEHGVDPAASHPQAALHRLLPTLGVSREDIAELGAPDAALETRIALLAEAFRPADTTESWAAYTAHLGAGRVEQALAGVELIVAADEREEALALALCMRRTLEEPGVTAALVTPDRALARRVRAELARWDIAIDDSGGEPLATSSYGVLARLALACGDRACMPAEWLALLAHPLARLGLKRAEVERLAGLLEIAVLRGVLTDRDRPLDIVAAARDLAKDLHAHPASKRISAADWTALGALVARLHAALAPLHDVARDAPLGVWIAAHRATLAALIDAPARDPAAPDESFDIFETLFTELADKADAEIPFRAVDYRALVDLVTREEIVRGPVRAHPRLKILGLLEARLINADVMLLAGLDESIWPPQTQTGAFLNRPMRAELGLSAPERRIGQTAHDFTMAMGAARVVISRAEKRGRAPTVPSRFLQRLEALAGDAFAPCRRRGDEILALARRLDRPARIAAHPRPEPRPPLELRPTRLSVTAIETLRRDPYSIYARHILGLQALDELGAEPGAREAGTQLHAVVGEFTARHRSGDLPADSLDQLQALAQDKLGLLLDNADYRAFQWPRIEAGLSRWLEWETERRAGLARSEIELHGKLPIPLDGGVVFTLSGYADRIDVLASGECEIIDYKTGHIPSAPEIKAGFAPQLPLEVAMLRKGAFTAIGALDVRDAMHVKLGTADPISPVTISKSGNVREMADDAFSGLVVLLNQFRDVDTPYLARPYPQFARRFSEFDHLARVKEWASGTGEEGGE
ncbi:MAG: addB [Hyphomicrobiales bacterium]|nr:addB [Hyphomicrobiales bacterium]